MADATGGTFVYFAYGSNMLLRRLRAADRTPSARVIGTGYLKARRLTFDKQGVDGSGKCDIEATGDPNDRVYGVLFEIDRTEKAALDRVESLGKGYDESTVRVVTRDGELEALTYTALLKAPGLKPFHWYRALVIAGAEENGLPDGYIDWLRSFESRADGDDGRNEAQQGILHGG